MIRVYREEAGKIAPYRISRITVDGNVELLPEDRAEDVMTSDTYQSVVITLDGNSPVNTRTDVVDGETVFFLP